MAEGGGIRQKFFNKIINKNGNKTFSLFIFFSLPINNFNNPI